VRAALLALVLVAGTAQPQPAAPVFRDPHPNRATPAENTDGRAFRDPNAGQRDLTPDQKRCLRFDRQIARADEQARQATTTGAQNQFAAQRQQLIEQRSRAGC
jgi:hypothetical protein